jgi:predicted HTH domain antitoxin
MHSLAIRDLKNNPSFITKFLENNESVLITKHNKPIGITMPLSDDMFSVGLKKLIVIEQYKNGLISMGKMAELLGISKGDAMGLLDSLNIDWLNIDENELNRQVEVAKEFAKK